MKHLLQLLLLFLPVMAFTQVVNTEKLRLDKEEKGFFGEASLDLGLARNRAGQTVRLGTSARLELRRGAHRWMALGAYNLTQFNDVDEPGSAPKNFANNGFGHLRYNYRANRWLTWEAFAQAQYDRIQQIDLRLLAGTGPRLRLVKTDSAQLYFGALYMFEHEESRNEFEEPEAFTERLFLDDHRLSTYLSTGLRITSYLTINHVTYFQPNLSNFSDFRISSETSLSVKLTNRLSLRTYFQLIYDTAPLVPVPNAMYVLNNGFSLVL
ncbi:MAG: DUF481 domain-containing protein [Lewinellaceae bacterium]|nr:DUF481 domain-containing protein [Lewinellaceae bacterium]